MRILFALFTLLLLAPSAKAQNELGIGVILGEPSGISVKQWVSRTTAFDAGLAWSFTNDTAIQIHADYLHHRVYLFETDEFASRIPVYFGLGGRVILGDDPTVGVRFPVGLGRTFREYPIEVFLELVPILDLAPNSGFSFNAAIGARYYLGR